MSGWVRHDGKGVPADAKPGVTIVTQVSEGGLVWEGLWVSGVTEPWDWSNYGTMGVFKGKAGFWPKVTRYRNPSTDAAVEALKALADNTKRKIKEVVR